MKPGNDLDVAGLLPICGAKALRATFRCGVGAKARGHGQSKARG